MTAASPPPGVRIHRQMVEITGQDAMNRIIAGLSTIEPYRTPLLRAARDGLLSLSAATHGQRIPARYLNGDKPVVAMLADDRPDAGGPEAWRQATRLLRWARFVVFHAAAGEAQQYSLVVGTALAFRRVLLIEVQPRHLPAWIALSAKTVPDLRGVVFAPHPDGEPVKETMQ